jgi:hypothetical protein
MDMTKQTRDATYIGWPIFASTAARRVMEQAQDRFGLEDCRIIIWINLQQVYDEVGEITGQFAMNSPAGEMVLQTVRELQEVHLWLKKEGESPRLENVSLGGKVRKPTTEQEQAEATLH